MEQIGKASPEIHLGGCGRWKPPTRRWWYPAGTRPVSGGAVRARLDLCEHRPHTRDYAALLSIILQK